MPAHAAREFTRLFQVQAFAVRDPHTQDGISILACTKSADLANHHAADAAYVVRGVAEARQNECEAAGDSSAREESSQTGTAYARHTASIIAPNVRSGGAHTTLGRNITERSRRQGQDTFEYYRDILTIHPSSRVLDYGCGSLRVGREFIAFLDVGNYFAMDAVPDYFEIGMEIVGRDSIDDKDVHFAIIDQDGVTRGVDFGADHVFCSAVMFHVHPEDIENTARNLKSLASRPCAKLIFDAKISEFAPERFIQSEGTPGWAWPLPFYQALLSPLELVGVHRRARYDKAPRLDVAHLEFRSPFPVGS
jgi:SAM-dependent methyltransferase